MFFDNLQVRFLAANHDNNILYEPSAAQVAREIASILIGALSLIGAFLPDWKWSISHSRMLALRVRYGT